jgi:hypothetical protein
MVDGVRFVLRHHLLMKSDVSEASSLVLTHQMFVSDVGHLWLLTHQMFLRWVTVGTDITAGLSQLFGTWVH